MHAILLLFVTTTQLASILHSADVASATSSDALADFRRQGPVSQNSALRLRRYIIEFGDFQQLTCNTKHAPHSECSASLPYDKYLHSFREQATAAFVKDPRLGSLPFTEQHHFKTLFRGLSISFNDIGNVYDHLDKIAKIPGVGRIWRVTEYAPPKPGFATFVGHDAVPQVYNGASIAEAPSDTLNQRSSSNLTTLTPIKIGIIDTGIDYTTPSLGGCFGTRCKVAFGRDFVGDLYTGDGSQRVPKADPMDCIGHGTHVAGIVAAQGPNFSGAIPDAVLGAYKVFGCKGGASSDAIVAALEQAYADGMDVVNLSIGGSSEWPETPEAKAAERLIELGVVVTAAQGNDGSDGLWSTSSPGVSPSVIAVGAAESARFPGGRITLTDPISNQSTTFPFASNMDPGNRLPKSARAIWTTDLLCEPLSSPPSPSWNNTVVFVPRGGCVVIAKAKNAKSLGALGIVVYNYIPGIFKFVMLETEASVPIVGVSPEDVQWLRRAAAKPSYNVQIKWTKGIELFDNPTKGGLAEFSSWGPGPRMDIKPDILAPGAWVYSSYLTSKGNYTFMSGTSMAAPLAAAHLGTIKKHIPSANVSELRLRILGTAIPVLAPFFNDLAHPSQSGAGLIQVQSAINTKALVNPPLISLNVSEGRNRRRCADVTYSLISPETLPANFNITYKLSHLATLSLNAANPRLLGPARNESNGAPVTYVARVKTSLPFVELSLQKPSVPLTICVTPPADVRNSSWFYGGHILATPYGASNEHPALKVTYSGLVGKLESVPALTKNGTYPYLRRVADNVTLSANQTQRVLKLNATANAGGAPLAALVFHLGVPVERVFVEIRTSVDSQLVGRVGQRGFLGRNGGTYPFYQILWDGTLETGPSSSELPSHLIGGGDWKYRVGTSGRRGSSLRRILYEGEGSGTRTMIAGGEYFARIMASRQNSAVTEVWDSPTFQITY
ncbi:hypothetical protein HDV05_007978 [Chytridiales sp. JEL 0842]|nr:hypothetical protein HDV05_007978 [Chytridiales sp. JEL 0842]